MSKKIFCRIIRPAPLPYRQNDWVGFLVDVLGHVLDVRSLVELGHIVTDVFHFHVDNRFSGFTLARILSLKEKEPGNEVRQEEPRMKAMYKEHLHG